MEQEAPEVAEAPEAPRKRCYFYTRTRGCLNGEACTYLHDPALATPEARREARHEYRVRRRELHRMVAWWNGEAPLPPAMRVVGEPPGAVPCRFYRLGACTRGAQCAYSHA